MSEKVPNESVDVEVWTERGCGVYALPKQDDMARASCWRLLFTAESPLEAAKASQLHNSTCATLRAEIARLRKILEEKGAGI